MAGVGLYLLNDPLSDNGYLPIAVDEEEEPEIQDESLHCLEIFNFSFRFWCLFLVLHF
jgi:hypothetical protein